MEMDARAYTDGAGGKSPHRVMIIKLTMNSEQANAVSAAIFDGDTRQGLLVHTPDTDHVTSEEAAEKVKAAALDFFRNWRGGYTANDGHISPWDLARCVDGRKLTDDDVPY